MGPKANDFRAEESDFGARTDLAGDEASADSFGYTGDLGRSEPSSEGKGVGSADGPSGSYAGSNSGARSSSTAQGNSNSSADNEMQNVGRPDTGHEGSSIQDNQGSKTGTQQNGTASDGTDTLVITKPDGSTETKKQDSLSVQTEPETGKEENSNTDDHDGNGGKEDSDEGSRSSGSNPSEELPAYDDGGGGEPGPNKIDNMPTDDGGGPVGPVSNLRTLDVGSFLQLDPAKEIGLLTMN